MPPLLSFHTAFNPGFQAMIESMSDCVAEEPQANSKEKLCTFRIRFPDGELQQRRFLATNTLHVCIPYCNEAKMVVDNITLLTDFVGFVQLSWIERIPYIGIQDSKKFPEERCMALYKSHVFADCS